jgi:hypothetical protein
MLRFMPRPTRLERLNNAIRQLRTLLASPGRSALNQAELSTLADIPLDTLRGVESGRAPLSELILNRIRMETGAAWNPQDERWRVWKVDGPLYAREHYVRYQEMLTLRQEMLINDDQFFASLRIRLLLETLSPKEAYKFHFRLNTFLEKSRKEFCPEKFAELFYDACGFIEVHPELDRYHPLQMRRSYPGRLRQHTKYKMPSFAPSEHPDLDELKQITAATIPTDFDLKGYEKTLAKQPESETTKPSVPPEKSSLPRARQKRSSTA